MGSEPGFAADLTHPILYEDEWDRITAGIDSFEEGRPSHIAVVAEPFAGQDVLMKGILRRNPERVIHLPFFSIVKNKDFLTQISGRRDIVVMDHCHFLAMRKIGGFAMLDALLENLSTSERLFITQWNTFTWSYLTATRHIDTFFPVVIDIPKIDSKTLKKLIMSRYTDGIEFVAEEPASENGLQNGEKRVLKFPFCEKEYSFTIPHIFGKNAGQNKISGMNQGDPESAAFDRIIRIADGNYGVAERIWERSLDGNTLRVEDIPDMPCNINLDINESFLLTIILSMESVSVIDLAEIAGPEINLKQTLFRLTNEGLITENKGLFEIKPESLSCVIGYLKRNRMVW